MTLEEIAAVMKDGHYHCAICFEPFVTHKEKIKHMEDVHGYDTLEVINVSPRERS